MAACQAFIESDDIVGYCDCQYDVVVDRLGEAAVDQIIAAASGIVSNATGGRVTGQCEVTVRPCADVVCGCWGKCICCNVDGINLYGVAPTVTQVKIDGATLGAELYKIVDGNVLVRADGGYWPSTQNVAKPDTEDGTFSITFTHGAEIGWIEKRATIEIACDLIQASIPNGKPRLPRQAINALMDGTTVQLDPEQLLGFPWMERLQNLYPATPRVVFYSPEAAGPYVLHTVG